MTLPYPRPNMMGPSPRSMKARQAYYRRKSREDARVQLALARAEADRAMWNMQETDSKLSHDRLTERAKEAAKREEEANKTARKLARLSPETRQMLELIGVDMGKGDVSTALAAEGDEDDDYDDYDEDDLGDLPADDGTDAE